MRGDDCDCGVGICYCARGRCYSHVGQSALANEAVTTTIGEHELRLHDAMLESLKRGQCMYRCRADESADAKPE